MWKTVHSIKTLGQRLSMDAAGVIAHYVMDGDQPLTAESGGNTTFYLYGIGEKTTAWSYSLPDGTNTPRQFSHLTSGITLTARYTPWGDALDTYGTGNFTFGYFGGVMDATTGLALLGNLTGTQPIIKMICYKITRERFLVANEILEDWFPSYNNLELGTNFALEALKPTES